MRSLLSLTISPKNQTLPEIVHNDVVRYIKKRFGLILAAVQAVLYFTLGPMILNKIYPTLIDGWDYTWFMLITPSMNHTITNLIIYTISYFVYTAKIPFLDQYRVSQNPWPWESDPQEWKELFRSCVKTFCLNHFIMVPLVTAFEVLTSGVTLRLSPDSLPTIKDTVLQIFFSMIVEDFCFYWFHRLLHRPSFYHRIHKKHHRYHHTVSIANEYMHPLEFILTAVIASSLGPKLLGSRMHITTFWLWQTMRIGESIEGHCGYEFPWSPFRLLPLSASATYHDFHHSDNVGNYGSLFTFWDTLMHSNREYWIWLSKRERNEKSKDDKGTPQSNSRKIPKHQKEKTKPEITPNSKAKKE